MKQDLYEKYGNYNQDGLFIMNHRKWDYYAKKPKLYRRRKIIAWLCLILIPMIGVIMFGMIFEEMGLSVF